MTEISGTHEDDYGKETACVVCGGPLKVGSNSVLAAREGVLGYLHREGCYDRFLGFTRRDRRF